MAEFVYTVYDENGELVDSVFGTSLDCVKKLMLKHGWTGVCTGGADKKHPFKLTQGQRAGFVYGRDRRLERGLGVGRQYRKFTYIREVLTSYSGEVPWHREDLVQHKKTSKVTW